MPSDNIFPELSLHQAEQSQPSQPPLLFLMLQALDRLREPLLDLLQNIHVPLVLGAQIWTQHSRRALTSVDQGNKDLCWYHCLMQPERCWTTLSQGHIAGAWSACLPGPQCFPWQSCFPVIPPQALHFPSLNFMEVLSAQFSSLFRCLWMAAQPSQLLLPSQTY